VKRTHSWGRRRETGSANQCAWLALILCLATFGGAGSIQQSTILVGSGSTIPVALFAKWGREYNKRKSQVQMQYVPVGSSEGLKQVSLGNGDFGAGEEQLSDKQIQKGLVALPVVLVGIVPIYNLPQAGPDLHLSGQVLAEIFLGNVKAWNDPLITRLNGDAVLPSTPIKVIYRLGGRGSNYVFTSFLSKTNPRFRTQIGTTSSPHWPVGTPARFSSELVDMVVSNPGSIGYAELQYTVKKQVQQAAVLNSSGHFIKASKDSLSAACIAVEQGHWNNFSASLTNASGAASFPITSFSWIYLRGPDFSGSYPIADLLSWMYTDGQQYVFEEGYAELPQPLLAAVRNRINSPR
jgi:phosphate transport system substrate-binding protein